MPEENADVKRECATDFDLAAANVKFDKSKVQADIEDTGNDHVSKPMEGYDKGKSFFDNISCEATDRAKDSERQKVDRDKAREMDKETFGDMRRPPRPAGGRRGKGKGRGGGGKR